MQKLQIARDLKDGMHEVDKHIAFDKKVAYRGKNVKNRTLRRRFFEGR